MEPRIPTLTPTLVRAAAIALTVLALAGAWLSNRALQHEVGLPVSGLPMWPNGFLAPVFMATDADRPTLEAAGVGTVDLVVAVDGAAVTSAADIRRHVRGLPIGTRVRYTLRRPWGATGEAVLPTRAFSAAESAGATRVLLVAGLVLIAAGLLPVLVRPEHGTARVFFLFTWAMGTNFGLLSVDYLFVHAFAPWSYCIGGLAIAAAGHLALSFPRPPPALEGRTRALVLLIYAVAGALSVAYVLTYAISPAATYAIDLVAFGGYAAGLLIFTGRVATFAWGATDPVARQQARVVLAGPLAAIAITAAAAATGTWSGLEIPAGALLLAVLGISVTVAYAIYAENVFELDDVARRALRSAVLVAGVAAGYLVVFFSIESIATTETAWTSAFLATLALVIATPFVQPLRRRVERAIDRAVFPAARRADDALRETARELARTPELLSVLALVQDGARRATGAAEVRVIASENPGGSPGASASASATGSATGSANADGDGDGSDAVERGALTELGASQPLRLRIEPADPLHALVRRGATLRADPVGDSDVERARLEALDIALVAPFRSGDGQLGALLLGPRADGRPYTTVEAQRAASLASQAAMAVAGARALDAVRALQQRLASENAVLEQELMRRDQLEELVGEAPAFLAALAQLEQVAPTDATVLVLGETGTGKELFVRALHRLSRRSEGRLVRVACSAIPESLLESELFGHEKGAFTGADARKIGRCELADGGALFLDDVDTLPLSIQAKLLRALQEGEVQRLGSTAVSMVDLRVLAATNVDLLEAVRAGRFREDLYYRLHVVPVRIPPLRERSEDVPLLARRFVESEEQKLGHRPPRSLSEAAMRALQAHSWPGNVRELRNVIERAVVLSTGAEVELPGPIAAPELVERASRSAGGAEAQVPLDGTPLRDRVRDFKIARIQAVLEASGQNQSRAAEQLGLRRQSLNRMLRDLGLRA